MRELIARNETHVRVLVGAKVVLEDLKTMIAKYEETNSVTVLQEIFTKIDGLDTLIGKHIQ